MFRFLPLWWLIWLFWKPRYKYQLVFGTSSGHGTLTPKASVQEAVAEAQQKVDQLEAQGWEAISVGVGGRAGVGVMGEIGPAIAQAGEAVDVVVLMRK